MKKYLIFALIPMIASCLSVRPEDTNAWVGEPVSSLELHPFFITVPVVKTKTSDGTEIWNYVNGRNIGRCNSTGFLNADSSGYVTSGTYNRFANCVSGFSACNNIFYIKDGRVLKYVPTGSGGMRCYTSEELQPKFRGSSNFR